MENKNKISAKDLYNLDKKVVRDFLIKNGLYMVHKNKTFINKKRYNRKNKDNNL